MKKAKIYKPDLDETYSLVNNGTGVVEAEINNGCSIKVNPEDEVYRQFSKVSASLSLQVKIIDSNNCEEIQNYINEFDTNENLKFDEITPLAFKKLILSCVNLPDKFYQKDLRLSSNDRE